MKIKDAVQEFNISLIGEIKEVSRRWYIQQLGSLLKYFDGREIESISTADLRLWRVGSMESGAYKVRSLNHHLSAVKRFFSFLVTEGVLPADPSSSLRPLQDENKSHEPPAISMDDFLSLLNQAATEGKVRDVAIILFLFGTGCRVSGLCALALDDLDLPSGRAWVVEKGSGPGKGRWVYLDSPVILALDKYLEIRPVAFGKAVFIGRSGPLSRQGVWYMLRRHAAAAGVSGRVNPHSFRHRFAIEMLMRGLSLSAVSQLLGHSGIQITHDAYGKFEQRQLQELHRQYSPAKDLVFNNMG